MIQRVGVHSDAFRYRKVRQQFAAIDYEDMKIKRPKCIERGTRKAHKALISNEPTDR